MNNKVAKKIQTRKEANDRIYTPPQMVDLMLGMCDFKDGDVVLDPCRGKGAFYDKLPNNVIKEWCEIDDGVDFFKYNKRVDWIVGNPPYSIWDKWLDHTMELTDKFVYVFGHLNLRQRRIGRILEKGFAITDIIFTEVEWWFGSSFLVKFEKGKQPVVKYHPLIKCPDCGQWKCGRGKGGKSHNICGNL
jgi:hypothetical protein